MRPVVRAEYGSPAGQHAGNRPRIKFLDPVFQEPLETILDAQHADVVLEYGCLRDSADDRVQSRTVSPSSEDADPSNFALHVDTCTGSCSMEVFNLRGRLDPDSRDSGYH